MQKLPIFTLPDTVLFPGVIIPLHIVENRYKHLLSDINSYENKLIISYAERQMGHDYIPKVHACIAEVSVIEESGRKNIVIKGLEYAHLGHTEKAGKNYYISDYEIYDLNLKTISDENEIRTFLKKLAMRIALMSLSFSSVVLDLLDDSIEIDQFVNKIIYNFLHPREEQQYLLEERYLESKYQYLKTYLTDIHDELKNNINSFDLPEEYIKKLN